METITNYIRKTENTLYNVNKLKLFGSPRKRGYEGIVKITFKTYKEAVEYLIDSINTKNLNKENILIEDAKNNGIQYNEVFCIFHLI